MSTDHDMPLVAHLIELRRRLLYALLAFGVAFAVCYYFSQNIFDFLIRPLANVFENHAGRRLIYTGLAEAFVTYIKVAFFAAIFISFPILLSQIWLFVAPGLYHQEKRIVFPFLIATPLLFLSGAAFAYYGIIPPAWSFFLSFETNGLEGSLPIQLEGRVAEYLSIVMQLILAFGICFQLPVALILLARLNVLTAEHLKNARKYSFLGILILSALLTPPDVLSMLGLAIPLYSLYEISIHLIKFFEKRRISAIKNGEVS
ncbi:MAG: twin-arginine translocase subunit TatC [Candidatus Nucleicultricaceae bacterium]